MIDTKSLKGKILDRALHGELTQQLSEDGTGELLYQTIFVKRQEQAESGEIKRLRQLPEVSEDEYLFEIPQNWKWVKLGNVSSIYGGKRIPAGRKLTSEDTGHKYIRVSEMKDETVNVADMLYVPNDIYPSISQYIINKEDVYITVAGTIGKVGKIPEEIDGANLTENADRIVFDLIDQDWLISCLSSSEMQRQIALSTTQVAQPKLAIKRIEELMIPLPPLAEQKRMVEILSQVFPILSTIDELQAQYSSDVEVLKSKIIDAGIQGKLTEQLPEDGTAEELYLQIQEEKATLIKAGRVKKSKKLPDINDEEIPFEIPENWKWVRLGNIIRISSGTGLTSHQMVEGDVPVYGGNGITGYHNEALVNKETIVIGRVGFYCGSVHVTPKRAWVTDNAFITEYPEKHIDQKFLVYALKNMDLRQNTNGAAQPVVSGRKIYPLLLALPPLAEQKRIANRIDEVLSTI